MSLWWFIITLIFKLFTDDSGSALAVKVQEEGDVNRETEEVILDERVKSPHTTADWAPPESEKITAENYVVMDKATGRILYSRNPNSIWPAASLTKLMTAIIFLDEVNKSDVFWNDEITIRSSDITNGTAYVYEGESVTLKDAFISGLVGSLNTMTSLFARSTGFSNEDYTLRMNARARALGLWNTHFSDVTGLSPQNVTTAKETAWLLKEALLYKEIRDALILPEYKFQTLYANRSVKVKSTNKLLESSLLVEGGKTGFTSEAKYNFAVSIGSMAGDSVIVVVLGSSSEEARFSDASALALWAFDNHEWF